MYQILFRSLELFSIHQKSQITDELVDHLAEPKNDLRIGGFWGEGKVISRWDWGDFGVPCYIEPRHVWEYWKERREEVAQVMEDRHISEEFSSKQFYSSFANLRYSQKKCMIGEVWIWIITTHKLCVISYVSYLGSTLDTAMAFACSGVWPPIWPSAQTVAALIWSSCSSERMIANWLTPRIKNLVASGNTIYAYLWT